MSEDSKIKSKRSAKRYPYQHAAQCEINEQVFEIQILNISTSGIQFTIKTKIETQSPIRIIWTDTQFGPFALTLLIAREIEKSENKEHQFYYGSQYYNLTPEMKDGLLVFLRHFKNQDENESYEKIVKITPEYLFDVIEQDIDFVKNMIAGKSFPAHFDHLKMEIKDYEKEAFFFDDEVSNCLQKITVHNFHFNILSMLTIFMAEKNDLLLSFFLYIKNEINKTNELESQIELISKNIKEQDGNEDEKKSAQKKINESSNRLYYTKQGLLQSVVETFVEIDFKTKEIREAFEKIKSAYEKVLQFTNSDFHEEAKTYVRRTQKPQEYSKVEAIVDLPDQTKKSPRYFLWFTLMIIFIFLFFFAYIKFDQYQERIAIKDKIGLQMNIKEFNREGSQLSIVVLSEDWAKLPISNRKNAFEKIVNYLVADKLLRTCVLSDEQKRVIKILDETTILPPLPTPIKK